MAGIMKFQEFKRAQIGEEGMAAGIGAQGLKELVHNGRVKALSVEHPSGITECVVTVDKQGNPVEAGMLRTARKLMDGVVFA